ncbi:MAG: SpoIIE family protein phosphatase [Hydrococcus sp. C42_A2020_068]|uniref:SpoIIE family protein phosphatase n=1 Tax=Pleurocapsa sp. PCC 7327 TaxID=118163 RepID=UPI00029FC1EA|nr:SpoIIE family protein phosphatase [Pleurocapsa sp. PCC 7327]AFY77968.1 Stage II sporulation protein E (SpoIIE) [Pleurocapsa sp. PCC 7327]MBF2019203.1 SpoIIE family protein phosphatase [Hydrococcus sp. C42_A2020_068]
MKVDNFLDIYQQSLNKKGEELCGDKVKYLKTDKKTTIVLSDGLGSGVKANILATLTTEILITMLNADVPLEEVLKTAIATLPICQVRKIAYSTFTIIQINSETNHFTIINFDNPPFLYFHQGKVVELETKTEKILDRKIIVAEGYLERGDFLGAISDGVLYAGMGIELNFGWGWDSIAKYIEGVLLQRSHTARTIVQDVIRQTYSLYHGQIGDDATFVGVYVRKRNPLMIFTGPPLNEDKDEIYVDRLLNFEGRKVICGGTTGNIVANYLGETIEMDLSTIRKDLPPIGMLSCVDLVTEGILTISKATQYIKRCEGDIARLKFDNNGAYLLAKEILQADAILFLVGQKINEFYQNPLLPKNISIRRSLIEDLVKFLREKYQKEVMIEYC